VETVLWLLVAPIAVWAALVLLSISQWAPCYVLVIGCVAAVALVNGYHAAAGSAASHPVGVGSAGSAHI
jgi:hypothetical protein